MTTTKILLGVAFWIISTQAIAGDCLDRLKVRESDAYEIASAGKEIRSLQPSFFGFNVEWLQFELGFWDVSQNRINAKVITALKDFPGAVYRYPGGMSANYFQWKDAKGEIGNRPVKKLEDWLPARPIYFGPKEYLDFVKQVNGKAWYVANLYGSKQTALPATHMAKSAGELTQYFQQLKAEQLPEIYRWELGNELDRSEHHWTPEKLANSANLVAADIKKQDVNAQFLVALQEYPAMKKEGYSMLEYNSILVQQTKSILNEYAIHLYYDDKPKGTTIDMRMRDTCEAIEVAKKDKNHTPIFWLTEHGYVPDGIWDSNAKSVWPETANLQAAINVADLLITSAQVPEIKGAMIHSLHGTEGPWPMLHPRKSGDFNQSAVFHALTMLRKTMLPIVLQTTNVSDHQSDYDGGYDVRGVIMTDSVRQHYSVWSVNRSPKTSRVTIALSALAGKNISVKMTSLADANLKANNYLDSQRAYPQSKNYNYMLNGSGKFIVSLPAYSVSSVEISPK